LARDGARCTYRSPDGKRCEQRGRLELHHEQPFGRGGPATVENIRVLSGTEPAAPAQLPLFEATPAVASVAPAPEPEAPAHEYKGRHPWSVLLRHTFALDVTACAHCQGRMTRFVIPEGVRLVELCVTAEAVQRVLRHAGPGPPPAAPPRRPRVHATQLRLPLHAG
jgi:hypothetical protein